MGRWFKNPAGQASAIKEEVRKIFFRLGAHAVGIAAAGDFDGTDGHHPAELFPACRSVIVYGMAVPKGTMSVHPSIVFKQFTGIMRIELDRIGYDGAIKLERTLSALAVPIPSGGLHLRREDDPTGGRFSTRRAAILAGLGMPGKNGLLLHARYGNTLSLGAVLTNLDLPSDPPAEPLCPDDCYVCVDACPAGALTGEGVDARRCLMNVELNDARGIETVNCSACRTVCPMRFGRQYR